ncbi:MAG: tetratricopeptide repeat protein, partial [Acidobacteriota bacterium]
DVVHDYASGGLGRNALSARRFRLFATTGREKSGLGGGLTLLFFLLAIASKEFVIVLPFLLWVMDGVWRGRWKPDRLLAGPFFISLVAMAGFFGWVKTSGEQTLGGSVVESLHYAKAQVEVIWFYAGLALVPRHLNIDHHIVLSSAAFDPVWWLALAGLVLLSWCLYRLSRGHQAAALAAFIFLAFLAPTSSFFPSQDLMFEHRVYASMLGFAFGIALVFQVLLRKGMALADRFSLGGSPAHSARLKLVLTLPFLGLLTLYAFLTLQRSSVWSSPLSLWRDAVSKSEGKYRPNLNLGVLLMAENDKQAEIYLSRAIEIDPSNPLAYRSLGRLYFEQDRVKAAESLWRQAVLLDPLHSKTHTALGKLYADRLNFINATRSLEEAIRLSPRDWEPHFYLAQLDLRFGLVVKAIHQSELGLQHAPDHTGLRFLLADAVSQQHNWQRAIELYQEGLRKDPQNARAYYGLGRAHWKAGERDSALESIRKGLAVAQSPAEIALGKKLLKRISP